MTLKEYFAVIAKISEDLENGTITEKEAVLQKSIADSSLEVARNI